MCTFDSSRNELKTFEGPDCVKEMIVGVHKKSQECIQEMKKNTEMHFSKKINLILKMLHVAVFAKSLFMKMKSNAETIVIEQDSLEVQHTKHVILIIFVIDIYL